MNLDELETRAKKLFETTPLTLDEILAVRTAAQHLGCVNIHTAVVDRLIQLKEVQYYGTH